MSIGAHACKTALAWLVGLACAVWISGSLFSTVAGEPGKEEDRVLMTGKPQHIPRQMTEDLTLLGGPACIVLTSRIWDHVVESYHSYDIGSSALACPFPLAGSRKWTPGPGKEPLALAFPMPGLCFG